MTGTLRPIFVVGAARSGTTLLQLMLNAHPRLSIPGELHFFDQICRLRRLVPTLHRRSDIDAFCRLVPSTMGFAKLPHGAEVLEVVRHRLHADPEASYERFYVLMMQVYAEAKGAARFGEKTPSNIWYLPDIRRHFPEAQIVEIVRDPRAVVASAIKVPFTSDDVLTNAVKWKCDVRYGLLFAPGDHGHLRVHYETLLADPEAELRRVCDFLGEDFAPAMLGYHHSAAEFIRDEPWKESTKAPIQPDKADRWRAELTRSQVQLIELVVAPECQRLGYPVYHRGLERTLGGLARAPVELWRYRRFRRAWHARPEARLISATNSRRVALLRDLVRKGGAEPTRSFEAPVSQEPVVQPRG